MSQSDSTSKNKGGFKPFYCVECSRVFDDVHVFSEHVTYHAECRKNGKPWIYEGTNATASHPDGDQYFTMKTEEGKN